MCAKDDSRSRALIKYAPGGQSFRSINLLDVVTRVLRSARHLSNKTTREPFVRCLSSSLVSRAASIPNIRSQRQRRFNVKSSRYLTLGSPSSSIKSILLSFAILFFHSPFLDGKSFTFVQNEKNSSTFSSSMFFSSSPKHTLRSNSLSTSSTDTSVSLTGQALPSPTSSTSNVPSSSGKYLHGATFLASINPSNKNRCTKEPGLELKSPHRTTGIRASIGFGECFRANASTRSTKYFVCSNFTNSYPGFQKRCALHKATLCLLSTCSNTTSAATFLRNKLRTIPNTGDELLVHAVPVAVAVPVTPLPAKSSRSTVSVSMLTHNLFQNTAHPSDRPSALLA
mmetsp:Transcript_9082/g.13426  ORF Transcript_9082/g.13426 Transcript_9082/m.13426 type:complete len:340 (+) Transcript_9082:811-1830(+)